MAPTEADIVRRREALQHALGAAGLSIAAPLLETACQIDWDALSDPDEIVAQHATWLTWLPARQHLPRLLRDFARLDLRSRVYLAGITGETLSSMGDSYHAMQWFRWANQHWQTSEQARWLHSRNTIAALETGINELVRPSIGIGAGAYALAQAKLGRYAEAIVALNRAWLETTGDRYTAFDYPAFQHHRFGSSVHTRLGNPKAARDHQVDALRHLPVSDVTSRALVNLDVAQRLGLAEDRREEGANHVRTTMYGLPEQYQDEVTVRRAREVSDMLISA